jgi:predicted HAD superfamily Cof-like phosphohydrolase
MTDSLEPSSSPSSPFDRVLKFHQTYGAAINVGIADWDNARLRVNLIEEELQELMEALRDGDIFAVADALADLEYVVNGAAISFGIDLPLVGEEVHRSNMSKLMPDGSVLRRADGKVLKGPDYEEPQLTRTMIRGRFGK